MSNTQKTATEVNAERSSLKVYENAQRLKQWLQVMLDQVDYTAGACSMTEMVGAVLPSDTIKEARKAIKDATEAGI